MDNVRHVQAHRHQDRRAFLKLDLDQRIAVRQAERDAAIEAYRLINPQVSPEEVEADRAARIKERMDAKADYRAENPQISASEVKEQQQERLQTRLDAKLAYREENPKHTPHYVEHLQDTRRKEREEAAIAHQEDVEENRVEYLEAMAAANGYPNWGVMFEWRFMTIAERREFRREDRHPGVLERQAELDAYLVEQGLDSPGREPVCRMRKYCHCDDDASDYRGTVSVTRSGKTCQAWHLQEPHAHHWVPENFPGDGLTVNYCRNPDGAETAWCHTTDENTKWEYCDVPKCDFM